MSNLPNRFPDAPDDGKSYSDWQAHYSNQTPIQSTPAQKPQRRTAILVAGVTLCVALVVGGTVALLTGGDNSTPSSEGAEVRHVIFGKECDRRLDKYGDKGAFDTTGDIEAKYWNSSAIPPMSVILNSLYKRDTNNRVQHSSRTIDPNSLSESQKVQLYNSLSSFISDETSASTISQGMAIGMSSIVFYGTVSVDGDSADGRIDSPDLNVCVGHANT